MNIDEQLELDLMRSIGKQLIKVFEFNDKLKLDNWVNRAASLLANRFAEMLGDKKIKEPDEIDKEVKGYAIWNNLGPLFNEKCTNKYISVSIYDRISHIHFVPAIHMDYCILSINIDLSNETIDHLHKIADSIHYDTETKLLFTGGDFPGSSLAQFAVIKRVNNKKIDISDAHDTYKIWVKILYDEWVNILKGAHINEAVLSSVLERYVLND